MAEVLTLQDSSEWSRGVLASYEKVTPAREDATRYKLTLRDALFLLVGVAGMWGAQVATQSKTQAAIENLGTKFDGYVQKQINTDESLQRQVDEARKQANLAIVNDALTAKELSELKGYLEGAGIKRVPK